MTNDRLSLFQIAVLAAYSIGMSAGQLLFKVAADRASPVRSLGERLLDWIEEQGGRVGTAAETLDRWEARRT